MTIGDEHAAPACEHGVPCSSSSDGDVDPDTWLQHPNDVATRLKSAFDEAFHGPLDTILGAVSALEHRGSQARVDHAQTVRGAVRGIEHAAREALALLTCSFGLPIHRRPVDLTIVCARTLDSIQRAHANRSILSHLMPGVLGEWDPDLIADLLSRLVRNAIENGPNLCDVVVLLCDGGDCVEIEVRNTGVSIPIPPLSSAFAPCARPSQPDLGSNLFIALGIARSHGGTIVASDTYGEGTSLRVTLPRPK